MSTRKKSNPSAICRLPAGGAITVQLAEGGRTFRAGDALDLEAFAAPGLTWRDALGRHADVFEPAQTPAAPAVAAAQE